jgi:predicted nucleic acid-binding protein
MDPSNRTKQEAARLWVSAAWETGAGAVSWQVLNEVYYNGLRKLRSPAAEVRMVVEWYSEWQPIGFSMGLLHRAWKWADLAGLNYWDALILASAEVSGCRWLLSEDFQHGRRYGTVEVVNPFRTGPEAFFRYG